jgi:hypothetical protein
MLPKCLLNITMKAYSEIEAELYATLTWALDECDTPAIST